MPNAVIHYLFPPQQIHSLPTWRFILHFEAPRWPYTDETRAALAALRDDTYAALHFARDLEEPLRNDEAQTVGVAVEVPPERRARPDALGAYEADVRKIFARMSAHGFGDLYYEAVDWHEDAP